MNRRNIRNRLYYKSIVLIVVLLLAAGCFWGCGKSTGLESANQNVATDIDANTNADYENATDSDANTDSNAFMDENLTMHFLDVGHGDATLITCGTQAMLVDCGKITSGKSISSYLKEMGIRHLDYLILTHPDSDHIGGASVILEDFSVENVLVSSYYKESMESQLLEQALAGKKLTEKVPLPGEQYALGEATFTMLGPVETFEKSNNMSLVFRLDYGQKRFLFVGDQEKKAEKALLKKLEEDGQLDMLDADLLKVGHHGKNDATGKAFLEAVSPDYAVISCGLDDGDVEPEEKALERLQESGAVVGRTDEQGTMVVTCDQDNIDWEHDRNE